MKFACLILFLVNICYVQQTAIVLSEQERSRLNALAMSTKKYRRVRCTRRYTVGTCLDHVRPVWTFVAHIQTCTERLGCPSGTFANRFDSLDDCMATCRDLIYLYMYLQSFQNNQSFKLPDTGMEGGRWRESNEYDQHESDEASSGEHSDNSDANKDSGFRRHDLQEALLELSADPDYPEQKDRDYDRDERDDRPPPDSEPPCDDRYPLLPDIDHF